MAFLQLQTEVGDILNMTIDASSTVSLTQVKRDINTARGIVLDRLLSLGQNYKVRMAKANLVASQSLYGLPTDFRKFVRVELGYESSGNRIKADQLDIGEIGERTSDSYSMADPKYTILGDMYEIRPTPTASVTDGLYLYYIEDPADMTGDTDTTGLPFDYDYLLPLYAAAKGKYTLGLPSEGDGLMGQFKSELVEMENDIVERNIDTNGRITIVDDYGGL